MLDFELCIPTKIYFGRGQCARVGEIIASRGYRRVLICYGGGSVVRTGLLERVKSSLDAVGVEHDEFGGIQANPTSERCAELGHYARERGSELLLAVGGGSVIDTAKMAAHCVRTGLDPWDYTEHRAEPSDSLPVGVVLTIAATGSETSDSAVLTNTALGVKRGLSSEKNRPLFAIMDPELTMTLPPYQTACGVVDIMAHMMERYFTRVTHVELIDRMTEGALKTVVGNAPIVMHEPENYDARAEIMWAGCLAHNTLFQTGRVGDWASHKLEHELSALYDIAHGAGLAIVFPAWMKYALAHDGEAKLAQFAVRVFDVPVSGDDAADAAEGIRRLEAFYRSLGLTTTLTENGIGDTDFGRMAERAVALAGGTLGQFVPLKAADCEAIYRLAL